MASGSTGTWSQGLKKLVEKLNNFLLPGSSRPSCLPFYVGDNKVGFVRQDVVVQLKKYPDVFLVKETDSGGGAGGGVYLSDSLVTVEDRDREVARVMEDLRKENVFVTLRGWRDERLSVYHRNSEPPLFNMERSAVPLIGAMQYGVHINGYTYKDGALMMWIGRRSKTKQTYPSMLDNMCAGALPQGLGVCEGAVKECQEEASVADHHLENLKSVGCISYIFEDERGVLAETQYMFDLEVPPDFRPVNSDGEMSSFELMPIEKVKTLMVTDEFKPNCALVVLDFLIRHSLVTPDNEPNYTYLIEMMHTSLSLQQ